MDFVEIEVTHNRTTAIHDKLCNLIAHVQELKIERESYSSVEKGYERKICSVDTADGKDRKRH